MFIKLFSINGLDLGMGIDHVVGLSSKRRGGGSLKFIVLRDSDWHSLIWMEVIIRWGGN